MPTLGLTESARPRDDVVVDPVLEETAAPVPACRQRSGLVSLSANSSSAPRSQRSTSYPASARGAAGAGRRPRPDASRAFDVGVRPGPQLRNQSVGSRCSVGRLGPRFERVISIRKILGRRLGVVDEHIEVPIVLEHARVDQLVLEIVRDRRRLVSTRSGREAACGYLYRYRM